jgi:adenosylmethionine-8-amino-7-oxononanoate aminotransferase
MTVDTANGAIVAGFCRELPKVSFDNEVKATTRRHAPDCAACAHSMVSRVVGDTIVRTPPLIASEDDIAAIVGKIADILKRLR